MKRNQNNPALETTSKFSYYIDDAYYTRLLERFQGEGTEGAAADEASAAAAERLIVREARLLDEARMEEWLQLYTADCLYWVPSSPGGGNPRKEISIAFDDRRRLEDRVYRLRTGYAWSQIPASRTVRLLGNFEVWNGLEKDELRVRCTFLITEFRAGRTKTLAGWYGYSLRREDGQLKIAVKQTNLVDCDQGHENLTMLL